MNLILLQMCPLGDKFLCDMWTVLSLFYLVWIFSWAKKALGSAKLAILFAVIVVYLTFFAYPWLVFIPVIIFILGTFGKAMFEKMHVFEGKE